MSNSWYEGTTPRTMRRLLMIYCIAVPAMAIGLAYWVLLPDASSQDRKPMAKKSTKVATKQSDTREYVPLPEADGAAWLSKRLRRIPMPETPVVAESPVVTIAPPPPPPPPAFVGQLIVTSVDSKPENSYAAFRNNGVHSVVRVGGKIDQAGELYVLKKVGDKSVELECRGVTVTVGM